jgi:hypothetical protein
MAEPNNQEVKSRRDMAVERLRERYPDKEFNDDEAIFGQISDDYDELDGQLNGYKEREQQMVDMMSADPRSAHFLANWHNGGDPAVELVRMFGTDIKDAIDDPEKQDAIAAANKEYVDRVAKSRELEAEYSKNLDASLETLRAFQDENGMSDEEVDAVMGFLEQVFADALIGKFSRQSLEMARKAINHDEDVAAAADDAEVKGRNAKINETLRRRQEGDGVAPLGGSAGKVEEPKRRMNIFDYAEAASKR